MGNLDFAFFFIVYEKVIIFRKNYVNTFRFKFGKNIFKVLCWSMAGAAVLYVFVAFSPNDILSLIACVGLGICTSMLWPGTLILMEEKIPMLGVAAYALMAAGGDLGASVAPQTLGIIVDNISVSEWAINLANTLSLSPEDIGFKMGMLIAAIFPILGLILLAFIKKHFQIKSNKKKTQE